MSSGISIRIQVPFIPREMRGISNVNVWSTWPKTNNNIIVFKYLVASQVAATRLQNKLSELGRPESEINAARQIVREAAHKVKNVHKRFGGHVITVSWTSMLC